MYIFTQHLNTPSGENLKGLICHMASKDKDNKETTKTTIISMATGVATVQAGARFQYSNFALEATIANGFYNDPLTGFNGGDMIANLGAFINF